MSATLPSGSHPAPVVERKSMRTQTVEGVSPADNDAQIVAAIARASRPAAQGPTTVVGIRNLAGQVYRIVHAVGAAESLALANNLEELGLVDDCLESHKVREGCDSIYGVPSWHPSQPAPLDKAALGRADDGSTAFVVSQRAVFA
jgi:hypothetical protein